MKKIGLKSASSITAGNRCQRLTDRVNRLLERYPKGSRSARVKNRIQKQKEKATNACF